jgi:hypothetical protein
VRGASGINSSSDEEDSIEDELVSMYSFKNGQKLQLKVEYSPKHI